MQTGERWEGCKTEKYSAAATGSLGNAVLTWEHSHSTDCNMERSGGRGLFAGPGLRHPCCPEDRWMHALSLRPGAQTPHLQRRLRSKANRDTAATLPSLWTHCPLFDATGRRARRHLLSPGACARSPREQTFRLAPRTHPGVWGLPGCSFISAAVCASVYAHVCMCVLMSATSKWIGKARLVRLSG